MDEARAWDLLGNARHGVLATTGPRAIDLVPICFAVLAPRVYLAIDAVKPKRDLRPQRLANIALDPQVSLLVDHYEDDDWDRLWWVRASGRATEIAGPEAEVALDALASRYRQYADARPPGPVVRIDVDRVQGWSADPGGI
ncbi:MAG: family class F420-dependent oxidoreductase [Actinomycetia bacterium]|nr:family class F420-dependent oxidoreductase [Actinomycetes bacterium]